MPTTTAATSAATNPATKTRATKTRAAKKPPTKTPVSKRATATTGPAKAPGRAAKHPGPTKTRTAAAGAARARSGGRRRRAPQPLSPPDRLFDVTMLTPEPVREDVERVPLEQITLAENPRKQISPDGIDRLSGMLMRSGQLTPAIGRRVSPTEVIVYAGQRRYLAAQRSPELAGSDGYEGLRPVVVLLVQLLDHEPTRSEIRRIQAQENQHEELSMRDRQEQFIDCWLDTRRPARRRPDRRRVRRARTQPDARPQPAPPDDAPRRHPHPRRRAPDRLGSCRSSSQTSSPT